MLDCTFAIMHNYYASSFIKGSGVKRRKVVVADFSKNDYADVEMAVTMDFIIYRLLSPIKKSMTFVCTENNLS